MRNDRLLTAAAVLVGVILIVIAIVYWAEPAKSLPSFFPGHDAHLAHKHLKHGLLMLALAVAALIGAWFTTAPTPGSTSSSS